MQLIFMKGNAYYPPIILPEQSGVLGSEKFIMKFLSLVLLASQ